MLHTDEPVAKEAVFRAAKRSKVFRRHVSPDTHHDQSSAPSVNAAMTSSTDNANCETTSRHRPGDINRSEDLTPVAELLRRRKTARARRGGIEFSNPADADRRNGTDSLTSESTTLQDRESGTYQLAAHRFVPPIGHVADTRNEHMAASIDSELPKLRAGHSALPAHNPASATGTATVPVSDGSAQSQHRQPASLGKLQEIDLGPAAALRNAAMTEAATRKLHGEATATEEQPAATTRLGRDGKPRRKRRRRNSDDVKRDEIVDAVLKESKLDLYDEPDQPPQGNGDQAADDLIAEEFRREYLDALQSRNNLKKPGAPQVGSSSKGGKVDDRPKGPKLGGSRSARAAMRALEEAAKKR